MRIVLVNPCTNHLLQTHRHGVGHLGLGYIAACLIQRGHDVLGIDAKIGNLSPEQVLDRIRGYDAQLVGITGATHEICHVGDLCETLKASMPHVITVVGGPHATALPERTLTEFPDVDAVAIGEGEQTACELADALAAGEDRSAWSGILGLAYRDSDGVHINTRRPPIEDLDALPFPAWEVFPKQLRWPLYAGRGCPFQCVFCQRVLGSRIRMRSVDNVLAEIDAMEQRIGVRSSWFQDETFGVHRRWTHEFLDKLIARNERTGRVYRWKANSRANLADAELYRKMRYAGCRMLDFGIESGCRDTLKRIHKSINPAQAIRAVRSAQRAGIHANAFFIIGHPGETWASALRTVLFAPRLRADDIAVGVMVPYPGTEVWQMARRGEGGYRLLTENWRQYDKYFGNALEIRGLSHRRLELLQVMTYLAFYIGTGRFMRLGKFVHRFHREATRMLAKLLRLPTRFSHHNQNSATPAHDMPGVCVDV